MQQHRRIKAGLRAGKRLPAAVAASAGLAVAAAAIAGPGDLDPSFGSAGRVSLDPARGLPSTSRLGAVIAQRDGRIVAVGTTYDGSSGQLAVARFEANGAIDWSFGNGGIANGTLFDEQGEALIEQSDGKLVVAGRAADNVALWRFDTNGLADAAFGTGGAVELDLGALDRAIDLVEQAGGKLVIAALTSTQDDADIALFRFEPDGRVDTTFGADGSLVVDFSSDEDVWETPTALVREPGGNLIVTGLRFSEGIGSLAVVRVTPDGAFDTSFGDDGRLELHVGSDSVEGLAAAVQDDGKIVIAGGVGLETGWGLIYPGWGLYPGEAFLARLEPAGRLDPSFGQGGVVIENIGGNGHFLAVDVQADGKIVAAGFTDIVEQGETVGTDMALTRFGADGRVDTSFGTGGTAIADFGSHDAEPSSRAVGLLSQGDGGLVVAGTQTGGSVARTFALARFVEDGSAFSGLIGFTEVAKTVAEDDGRVEFRIRRTGGSAGLVGVSFGTLDLAATADADYSTALGRLEWADGDTSDRSVTITISDDSGVEGDEQFELNLGAPTGGAVLAASRATVTIADNEPPVVESQPAPVAGGGGGGGGIGPLLLLALLSASLLPAPRRRWFRTWESSILGSSDPKR